MKVSERIFELLKIQNKRQTELAAYTGIANSSISDWKKKGTNPLTEYVPKIAAFFNVSTDYLLTGIETKLDVFQFRNIYPVEKRRIPLLGDIACGKPIYTSEDRESYVEIGTNIKADFCLKAKGDSMINARICDGDIVFVKEQSAVNNGEIAVVLIGDEATLKRVFLSDGKLILQAENPAFAPLVYIGEELNSIRILGKAIAFQSDVK